MSSADMNLSCQEDGLNSFGSNVSRLKSRFLQSSSTSSSDVSSVMRQPNPVSSGTVPNRLHCSLLMTRGIHSSPEIQRRVNSAAATSAWSSRHHSVSVDHDPDKLDDPMVSSTSSLSSVLDISDHVERFKHTRALFAQLAERSSVDSTSSVTQPRANQLRQDSGLRSSPPPVPGRLSVTGVPVSTRSPSSHIASPSTPRDVQSLPVVAAFKKTALIAGQINNNCNSPSTSVSLSSTCVSVAPMSGTLSPVTVVLSGRASSPRTDPDVKHSSLESIRRCGGDVNAAVVLRRNARHSAEQNVGSRAVLLPKRRSREEKTLTSSKEELEACLSHADDYWRRQRSVECLSPTMSETEMQVMNESTFSSGSGEEMARSSSGHDLAVISDALTSPLISSAANIWPPSLSSVGLDVHQVNGETVESATRQCNSDGLGDEERTPVCGDMELCQDVAVGNCESNVECNGMLLCADKTNVRNALTAAVGNASNSELVKQPEIESCSKAVVDLSRTIDAGNDCLPTVNSVSKDSEEEDMKVSLADSDCKDLGNEKQHEADITSLKRCSSPISSPSTALSVVRHTSEHAESQTIESTGNKNSGGVDTVQAMSVSEDEESGETDYVVLGQPIGKKPRSDSNSEQLGVNGVTINGDLTCEQQTMNSEHGKEEGVSQNEAASDVYEQRCSWLSEAGDGPYDDCEVHMMDNGSYYFEIEGIPEYDVNDDDDDHSLDDDLQHKKTAKVQFSKAPIKVFSTYAVEDYDRRNEDIDPLSASAEYELEKRVEKMDLFEVELDKGPEGLGLSIIGMGVGADAGLEKLGIFIKTLTENGAAQRDGRIQVNDQIIEVDGKSLVGVTQAYAASVLRNTVGKVRFILGRERDSSKSEVARLIQMSIEQDRRRAEQRRLELEQRQHQIELQQRIYEYQLQQQLCNTSAVTERDHSSSLASVIDKMADAVGALATLESSSVFGSGGCSNSSAMCSDGFDMCDDSGSEAATPDMESQVLFVKLKEAQYKNAVSDAELAKLKAKMILLQNAESQRRLYEHKCDDMAQRLRDSDHALSTLHKELAHYQDMLECSQGQCIDLEKQLRAEYSNLDKKYKKAKKLIRDYQHREQELLAERETVYRLQLEKEQQFNELLKSLKERMFSLEEELAEARCIAGLPPKLISQSTGVDDIIRPIAEQTVVKPRLFSDIAAVDLLLSESDNSSPEGSPDSEMATISADLNAIPETVLLDVSANKTKGQLSNTGSIATRRRPSKQSSSPVNSVNSIEEEHAALGIEDNDLEQEDEPFFQHDSENTVRKNRRYHCEQVSVMPMKRKGPDLLCIDATLHESELLDVIEGSLQRRSGLYELRPSEDSSRVSAGESNEDIKSEANLMTVEPIRTSSSADDSGRDSAGETDIRNEPSFIVESSACSSPSDKRAHDESPDLVILPCGAKSAFHLELKQALQRRNEVSDCSPDSLVLAVMTEVASRQQTQGFYSTIGYETTERTSCKTSLAVEQSDTVSPAEVIADNHVSEETGRASDVKIGSVVRSRGQIPTSSNTTDISIGRQLDGQSCDHILVSDWTVQHVAQWLDRVELSQYSTLFTARGVNGATLLQLDTTRMKALGISSSKDRDQLKKKLKDMRAALERERKQQERDMKARERLARQLLHQKPSYSPSSSSSGPVKKRKFFGK